MIILQIWGYCALFNIAHIATNRELFGYGYNEIKRRGDRPTPVVVSMCVFYAFLFGVFSLLGPIGTLFCLVGEFPPKKV